MKKNKLRLFFKNSGVQAVLSSLVCILLGLLIGYIVLLFINPDGAAKAIGDLVRNFMNYSKPEARFKYFGDTLVKTAPLIMCSLSILFCYKVGLFNIGAAGQYALGIGLSLYAALAWNLPWWVCILLAAVGGALSGAIGGLLKAYCNVNEVISGIMLNWISLYSINMLLTNVKEEASPYTVVLKYKNPSALIPPLGLDKLFLDNEYMTIAVPLAIIISVLVWVMLEKTKFGYELKATGFNKNAAKYCGMNEKRNIIVTLAIGGALAATGAAFFYLTSYEQWNCSTSSVPAMGFNGIAAAFLGGLNPIGSILSSFFIQHITEGGSHIDKMLYPSQISDLISAIIIYLCGFVFFMKYALNKHLAKKDEKDAAKQTEAKKEGGNK